MHMPVTYVSQIVAMAGNGREWVKDHPGVDVKVQFNFTSRVFLIQPISEAVKMRMVSCNQAGEELLQAMWSWEAVDEPTVMMCKMALEAMGI